MNEIAPGITVDPQVRFGCPVVAGTRVPVDLVLARLGAGMTSLEVCDEYGLTLEGVMAALRYAAAIIAQDQVRMVAS